VAGKVVSVVPGASVEVAAAVVAEGMGQLLGEAAVAAHAS